MDRTLKVFCTGADQERLAGSYTVVERYDGFILLQVPEESVTELTRTYPVEDITEHYALRVGERLIDTAQPRVDARGRMRAHPAYKGLRRLAPGRHHYLVQFVGPIKDEWLRAVEKAGGKLRAPFAGYAWVVRADDATRARIAALPCVRWVGHLPHEERIARSVLRRLGQKVGEAAAELPRTRVLPGAYTVEFFDPADMKAAATAIRKLGFDVLGRDADAGVLIVREPSGGRSGARRIRDLSAVHGVRFIRERSFKRPSNDVAAGIMGTSAAVSPAGLDLSGTGEVVAICDTGIDSADPASIHPDFAGRIAWLKSYPITPDLAPYVNNPGADDGAADLDSGHGTHVSGSVLGDGSVSTALPGAQKPIRGLAYKARLVFQAVEQEMQWKNAADRQRYGRYLLAGIPLDLGSLFAEAYAQGARIHSDSWGGGDPGAYDAHCGHLDRFVWEHPDFCVVVANGNDGTDADGDGTINSMSVSSPATAKNCISVGACESERSAFDADTYGGWWPSDYPAAPYRSDPMANSAEQVAAFSSRGPTQDGRIKPDVVAPGTFILSTRSTMIAPNNMAWSAFPPSRLYFYMGGTSMATPLTAGAVALVREYLRTRQGVANPSAALLKATLVAGARRLPGYGAAGDVCDIHQGYGRVNLDAVLAPPTPASAAFAEVTPGLRTGEVHSTHIEVATSGAALRVVLAYSDYPGSALVNNLNLIVTAPDGTRRVGNQSAGGGMSMDAKNNVEVVHVPDPRSGSWRVDVVGSNVPQGPQPFALVWLAHTGAPQVETVVRGEASPALAIPDNSSRGVSSTIALDGEGSVGSVRVGVDIAHTYIGDLRVALSAPGGASAVLHDRAGASAQDLVRTYDAQSTPALVSLAGGSLRGEWRLAVTDLARRDTGTLRRWSLEVTPASAQSIRKTSNPALAIPDNDPAGVTDGIDVERSGRAKRVKVSVDITHTWIGDLSVVLAAPSGKTATLHARAGGSADNLIRDYDPDSLPALAALAGENIAGTWSLEVADNAGRDIGKLNRWALEIGF